MKIRHTRLTDTKGQGEGQTVENRVLTSYTDLVLVFSISRNRVFAKNSVSADLKWEISNRIWYYALRFTSIKGHAFLYLIGFCLLTFTYPLWAQEASPARGRWLSFPGDREAFLEVEDNPSLNLKSQITIEAWIYPRHLPQLPQSRWQLVQKGTAYNLALWRTAIPGEVLLEINRAIAVIRDGVKIGAWNHVGGAYDGKKGEAWFYVNGKTHRVENVEPRELESQSSLKVGQLFDGGMDALHISKTVRYRDDYEPPMTHFETDHHTVLLWHFENRKDASKNENGFEARGEGIQFMGEPFRPVEPVGKLAISWSQIKGMVQNQ
jgi:hypothetical protein